MAVGLVSSPIWADPITELVKTKVKYDDDEYDKIKFKLAEKVPTDGSVFGGYAIFTSGHVIAVTSHPSFYDSETQTAPSPGQVALDPFPGPAAVCNVGDVACGAEWHTHMVEPVTATNSDNSPVCAIAAVGALTFEEVSEELKVKAKKIVLKEIESDDFTDAVSGNEKDFTAGSPVDADVALAGILPEEPGFQGVGFDLHPTTDDLGNLVVCIGPPL